MTRYGIWVISALSCVVFFSRNLVVAFAPCSNKISTLQNQDMSTTILLRQAKSLPTFGSVIRASFIADDNSAPRKRRSILGWKTSDQQNNYIPQHRFFGIEETNLRSDFEPLFARNAFSGRKEGVKLHSSNSFTGLSATTPLSHFFSSMEKANHNFELQQEAHFFPAARLLLKTWTQRIKAVLQATLLSYCALNSIWYTLGLTITWRRIVPVTTYGNALLNAYSPVETLYNALFTLHVGSQVMQVLKAIIIFSLTPLAHTLMHALHQRFNWSQSKIVTFSIGTMASVVLATWTAVLLLSSS